MGRRKCPRSEPPPVVPLELLRSGGLLPQTRAERAAFKKRQTRLFAATEEVKPDGSAVR